jgi:LacI family transcriptional regulator
MGLLGLRPRVIYTGADEAEAADVVRDVLGQPDPPTAIFGGNDTLAVGALRAVVEAGLTARDVSVVGYDNTTIASHPLVSLTSVDQDGRAMGREAVRLLLERIRGRTESVQIEMPVALRVRRSTDRPREA